MRHGNNELLISALANPCEDSVSALCNWWNESSEFNTAKFIELWRMKQNNFNVFLDANGQSRNLSEFDESSCARFGDYIVEFHSDKLTFDKGAQSYLVSGKMSYGHGITQQEASNEFFITLSIDSLSALA
jgi:hypothetical protein